MMGRSTGIKHDAANHIRMRNGELWLAVARDVKIAGGCTIIYLLDGVSLRSSREDAGGIQ